MVISSPIAGASGSSIASVRAKVAVGKVSVSRPDPRIWLTRLPTPGHPRRRGVLALERGQVDIDLDLVDDGPVDDQRPAHRGGPDDCGVIDASDEVLGDPEPGEGVVVGDDRPCPVGRCVRVGGDLLGRGLSLHTYVGRFRCRKPRSNFRFAPDQGRCGGRSELG